MNVETINETNTEFNCIVKELKVASQIEGLRDLLAQSRKARRAIEKPSAARVAAQVGADEARAKVDRLNTEKAEAKALLKSLNDRLGAGDETVSVEEIVAAEKAIERVSRLVKPAKVEATKTERALEPLLADEHLAHLTADVLETITDVPVVAYKVASEAPEVEPLIVVSQTRATSQYGTLDANGQVTIAAKGTAVDSKALKMALERIGSKVSVTKNAVIFDRAAWPLPRLASPSHHALAKVMVSLTRAFKTHVSGGVDIKRVIEAGYSPNLVRSEWNGLLARQDETLEVTSPGEAVGTATFMTAAQHDRGDSASTKDVKGDLELLVASLHSELVGTKSEAGQIESIELVEAAAHVGHGNPWTKSDVVVRYGEPQWPVTVKAVLKVTYSFDPA